MKQQVVNDHLSVVQGTLEQWISFRRFMNKAYGADEIAPDDEASFLEVKSAVARNVRTLTERSKTFAGLDCGEKTIRDLLNRCVSVGHLRALPQADKKMIVKDWHNAFVRLSRSVGALKFMSEGYVPDAMRKKKRKGKGAPSPKTLAGGAVGVVIALVAAYFVAQALGFI